MSGRRCLLLTLVSCSLLALPPARPTRIRVSVWSDASAEIVPSAFRVRLDGEPSAILATKDPSDDLMLILVLDFTGDFERVEIAKDAAIEAVRQMRPNTTVALLRAQDGMRVVIDPTIARDKVGQAIRDLPVSGKAGFLDTLEPACRVADGVLSKSQVRAAVVYLTDSSIYNHRADYANPVINASDSHDMSRRFPEGLVKQKTSSLEAKVAGLQAPLFLVQLAYRSDRLEQAFQAGQLQLAAATGGSAQFCRSSAEIPEAIAAAFAQAAGHYTLDVRLPEHHGRAVQLHVENEEHSLNYRGRFLVIP